ncbi:MAG: hypothetical protein ACR2NZ_09405, partial [Rubripirellula sp.]
MNQRDCLAALAVLLGLVVALPTVVQGQDRKEQVTEILADMVSRRDQMKSYAVVLFGTDGPVDGERQPFVMVRVFDEARQFDLCAHYRYTARYLEYGSERVTTANGHKWRSHPVTNYYLVVPKGDENRIHRSFQSPIGHDPFDDWFTVSGVNSYMPRSIDEHLGRYPLQSATMVDGKLSARFINQDESAICITTFDPAIEHMPIRGEIRNIKNDQLYHAIDLTWEKTSGHLLPSTLVYEHPISSRNRDVTTLHTKRFKLYWLFGEEIPSQVFTGPDHLLPLLDHFQLPHSRYDKERDFW